jgi:hypothetical protein
MVGERPMRILDKRFRNCVCPNIRNGIDCMQKSENQTMIMIKRAKSLERRIR